jgi:hypothetical protein
VHRVAADGSTGRPAPRRRRGQQRRAVDQDRAGPAVRPAATATVFEVPKSTPRACASGPQGRVAMTQSLGGAAVRRSSSAAVMPGRHTRTSVPRRAPRPLGRGRRSPGTGPDHVGAAATRGRRREPVRPGRCRRTTMRRGGLGAVGRGGAGAGARGTGGGVSDRLAARCRRAGASAGGCGRRAGRDSASAGRRGVRGWPRGAAIWSTAGPEPLAGRR